MIDCRAEKARRFVRIRLAFSFRDFEEHAL